MVVVGKSRIVGLPLFILLSNRNATVSLCHIYTQNLRQFTIAADILIIAIGRPKFINKSYVK